MSVILSKVNKSFMLDGTYSIHEMIHGKVDMVEVLHNINLNLQNGQICGVLGKNGAGKSTLLRVVGGIYSYDGMIDIDGNISSIYELGAVLNRNQTGRDYCNDFFLFTMDNYDKNVVSDLIEGIKKFTELGDYFERPVRTYSSGMLAKLLFGAATAISADVVLIDEALVVGDAIFQRKARKRLWDMLGKGTTGIVVSHDWTSLLRLCTVGVVMEHGRIAMYGDIRDCIKSYIGFSVLESNEICVYKKEELCSKKCNWSESGTFEFDINVKVIPSDRALEINIMVEKFRLGEGWNIVYTNGALIYIDYPGIYHLKVFFPKLMLADGNYNLGIHLSDKLFGNSNRTAKSYDRMQWLEHSEVSAVVKTGFNSSGVFKERIKWQKRILQK